MNDYEINEYLLQITGSASIPKELDRNKRLYIKAGELEIYSISDKDNQDGTYNRKYSAKMVSHVDLEQGDEVIRSKDKKPRSKQLKGAIYHLQEELGIQMDDEEFYDKFMVSLMMYLPEIYMDYLNN